MLNYTRSLARSELTPTLNQKWQTSLLRRWIYPLAAAVIYLGWVGFMAVTANWSLFQEYWPISVTMMAGSFVAGATPLGGAAVAFPVFTKLLHIPATDARTFGLMIQAVGMTMAAVVIIARRVKILPHVIGWVSLGGVVGMGLGVYWLIIPPPYPKVLFTFVVTAFGLALALARWGLKWSPRTDISGWDNRYRLIFSLIGLGGGVLAANIGSGINMLTFMVLTLAFGVDERISIPTTVVIMALNSIVGFFIYGALVQNIGIVWSYWVVALPIIIVGAPLGAYVASLLKRDHLIVFVLGFIGLELATTIWLVQFDSKMIVVTIIATLICAVWFWVMLRYRQKSALEPVVSS